jgi:hypothetical protein
MKVIGSVPLNERIKDGLKGLYPNSTWIWVCGYSVQPNQVSKLRTSITADLLSMWNIGNKHRQTVTVLVDSADPLYELVVRTAKKLENWEIVAVGNNTMLDIPNKEKEMARATTFSLMYGEPPSWWEETCENVSVLDRTPKHIGVQIQPFSHNSDPYADYHAIVEYVRRWWIEPFKGLQIRDMVDMRPKAPMPSGHETNN